MTDTSEEFLKPPATLKAGVGVARTPPTIDFLYFPGQTYPGKPWSNWGDGLAVNGKYYTAIGDHLAPAGNAFVFEYDPANRTLRQLVDLRKVLGLPDGHYSPGKIHSRIDLGATAVCTSPPTAARPGRPPTSTTTRATGSCGCGRRPPRPRSSPGARSRSTASRAACSTPIASSTTAAPPQARRGGGRRPLLRLRRAGGKLLYEGPDGPSRSMIFAKSTGRVYYTPGTAKAR